MKLTLRESLIIEAEEEARKRRSDLNYIENHTKKVLSKVATELHGTESAAFTKIARTYSRIDQAIKKMNLKKNELHTALRDDVEKLFAAEDALLTRVAETASFIITLSKDSKKDASKTYDYEKIAAALKAMLTMTPELEEKIKLIYDAYEEIIPEATRSGAMRVDKKVTESISATLQKIIDRVKKIVDSAVKSVASWATGFDKKFNAIKASVK